MSQPNEPRDFLGDLLGQFGKFTGGGFGNESAAPGSNASAAFAQMIQRGLAAANMPNRAELEDLSARIGRIEAALFRIEAMLAENRAAAGHSSPPVTSTGG